MHTNGLKGVLMYRFSRNASALLLLAITIAAAGIYARFTGELAIIDSWLDAPAPISTSNHA